MPTRLFRSDRIANIVDFGALENNAGASVTNATAFQNALLSGARRIAIPGGIWYFHQIVFAGNNNWLPFGVEIFGQGVQDQTILRYVPTNDALPLFWFAPGISRSTVRHLRIEGRVANGLNTPPVGTAISCDNSLFNRIRDVLITDFNVGIQLQLSGVGYSAHNIIERFEIILCRTGIDIGNNSNNNLIQGGRIWESRVLDDDPPPLNEVGFGINVRGVGTALGPSGAQALVIDSVTIEACVVGLRVQDSRDIAVRGCYFEPGAPLAGSTRRRSLDVDALTLGLSLEGNLFSEPGVPLGEENWTPKYVDTPPEARGVNDASSFPVSGNSYLVTAYGAGLSGTTAAHANRIRNADMSRGAMGWTSSAPPPNVTPFQTPFVTGRASTRLQVAAGPLEHVWQEVLLDSGVRTVTVCVRYQLLLAVQHAFRFELWDPLGVGTRLGFFSDVGPAAAVNPWRVASLTGRFDGLAGGVVGPRRLQVRIYPYNGAGLLVGQSVLIDSVWLLDGEYAATYRPYTEGVELLVGDDRQVFFGGVTTVPLGPTAAAPTLVPSNAIGMVVEMLVQGADASATTTILRVNDLSGALTTRDVHAFVSGRPTLIEYTLPFNAAAPPQWSVLGASVPNSVDYSVRLKKWILRL